MRFLCFLLLASCLQGQQYEGDYSPLLDQNTSPSNPGLFLRLMPTGLAYMREIGMKVVNEQILKLALPTIRERIDNGEVAITNAYISKYWAPQEYSLDLVEPNAFTWSMSKMHIRAAGEFQASINSPLLLPTVPISGVFETLLGHVALSISVHLERNEYGAPQVRSAGCQSAIGYVDLNVRNTGVITDFFINAFKAFLIGHFKPQVEQRMCRMIESIIDGDMNQLLSTIPLKVRINEEKIDVLGKAFGLAKPARSKLGQRGLHNVSLLYIVENLREKDLVLDYQLTSDPFFSNGAISMMSKGEISWRGRGGTPFFAPTMKIGPPHGVHMIEFFASDYLANSMLYHAYKQKYMDLTIGPESSTQLQDLLVTSCSTFCVGEFLGNLSEEFPDREVEVEFIAKKAPLIVFVENRARFRLHGKMNMFVRPAKAGQKKELFIRADTTLTANVNMYLLGSKIVGNATIENLDFKLLESKLKDVDQSSFADLGLFGAEFLEKLFTEILQLGIAIPSMQGVILKSPKLSFHDRFLRVQTYFKLDEQYAGELVKGAVRQTLFNVG